MQLCSYNFSHPICHLIISKSGNSVRRETTEMVGEAHKDDSRILAAYELHTIVSTAQSMGWNITERSSNPGHDNCSTIMYMADD